MRSFWDEIHRPRTTIPGSQHGLLLPKLVIDTTKTNEVSLAATMRSTGAGSFSITQLVHEGINPKSASISLTADR
jgi:hypothetical protein